MLPASQRFLLALLLQSCLVPIKGDEGWNFPGKVTYTQFKEDGVSMGETKTIGTMTASSPETCMAYCTVKANCQSATAEATGDQFQCRLYSKTKWHAEGVYKTGMENFRYYDSTYCQLCDAISTSYRSRGYNCQCQNYIERDCLAHFNKGRTVNGLYTLKIGNILVPVYCDMWKDGGGWTVIQYRRFGTVLFNRTWAEYKAGFGDVNTEFWLGLENIHKLTTSGNHEMRVDFSNYDNTTEFGKYDEFAVEGEEDFYKLNINGYQAGTADQMSQLNGMHFSTPDGHDYDAFGGDCARIYNAGWWYKDCRIAELNAAMDKTFWSRHINKDGVQTRSISMLIRRVEDSD